MDQPFFLLPQAVQDKDRELLTNKLSTLYEQLVKREAEETSSGRIVTKTLVILKEDQLNEYELAKALSALLEKISAPRSQETKQLKQDLSRLSSRAKPLWLSEARAGKQRSMLSEQEILEHDKNVLKNEIQLWAFDFVFVYEKLLREAEASQKEAIIRQGHDDLPSLVEDALSDSILTKCIYNLYGISLRQEMIRDYYEYKQPFLRIKDGTCLADPEIRAIETSLRQYCLKLIDISLQHGIQTVDNVLHFPYGKGKDLQELQAELNN